MSFDGPVTDAALDGAQLTAATSPEIRVALGEPGSGLAGFMRSHVQASKARHVATLSSRPTRRVTRYGRVALAAVIAADPDQARRFVSRTLGALAADDDQTRRLAATVQVYLEEHASRIRAAKRLGIHENTITYRLRQAEQLLGRSVEHDPLQLRVALSLATTLGDARNGAGAVNGSH